MSGEINGTKVLLLTEGNAIFGQMELSSSNPGTPISIMSKSTGDNTVFMDGEAAGQGDVLTGTVIYNDDESYYRMKDDARNFKIRQYTVDYGNGHTITADYIPSGVSDSFPQGDKVASSVTLTSSGPVDETFPTDSVPSGD